MKFVDCYDLMRMMESTENQMCPSTSSSSSSFCFFFRNYLLNISSSSSIPSSVLLISITLLISSTIFLFKLTKKKHGFVENQVEDEHDEQDEQSPEVAEVFRQPEFKNEPMKKEMGQIHEYPIPKSSDFSSETESGDISFSSEDSDADWSFRNQFPMIYSDDSISDDDSLIEIELPGGHYIGSKEEPDFEIDLAKYHYNNNNNKIGAKEEPKFKMFQNNMPELFQESIFGKDDLMELLTDINEMNEEDDNLIEIDISIGSIKCSRLEIEA